MTTVPLRIGRNLRTLEYKTDNTERASRIAAQCATLGSATTVLGSARWKVVSVNSGAKTLVLEDPAGGAGPIGFDDQLIGWYLVREQSADYALIDDSVESTQTLTLHTWLSGLAAGNYVEVRTTAGGSTLTPYSYRSSQANTNPPSPKIPIYDAEVTTLVAPTITIRDGWDATGAPITYDGQHVGRSVRLSQFLADDTLLDFSAVGGAYVYTVASVTAYQVGDWMRRAVDLGDTVYHDINTVISPGFPGGMTITATDPVANTLTVVSRDGLNRVIYDNIPVAGGEVRFYRPNITLRTVTDSSGSAKTLTLDSTTGFSIAGGRGAAEILIPVAASSGKVPYYLDHPTYVQPTFPGIGVKLRTIDRTQVASVSNLVENSVMRTWTTATALPDGWTFVGTTASSGIVGASNTPTSIANGGYGDFAQNEDPLYTQIGGQSLFFSITQGILISPPIPWTPAFDGQTFSHRSSIYLTKWNAPAFINVRLGIRQADGVVLPWFEDSRSVLVEPTKTRANYSQIAANGWDDLISNGADISLASTDPTRPHPDTSDIAAMSSADGIVVCYFISANSGTQRVEGYLDGVVVTASDQALDSVSEFGNANGVWQASNVALGLLAPVQGTFAVDVVDLQRLNPTTNADDLLGKGTQVLLNDTELGLINTPQRVVEIKKNWLKPGDTTITLSSRRKRLTEIIVNGQTQQSTGLQKAIKTLSSGPPTNPINPTNPTVPTISLSYTIAPATDVPS